MLKPRSAMLFTPLDRPATLDRARSKSSRGSTLQLVLRALILLSFAVLGWSQWIRHDLDMSNEASLALEARAMAHSGVAMALNPAVSQASPQLEREFGQGLGYRVRMVSEGGKLNINALLVNEDPRKLALLKRWLEQMGLEFQERERLVDCLLDYVDADNLKRLNGVEDDGDYHPPNRQLTSVDELKDVAGTEPLTSIPGWKDHLTIYGGGKIDLTAAPPDILRLLPGLGDPQIQRFVQFRAGADGVLGTLDDPVFKDLAAILSWLGMNRPQQTQELSLLITAKDPTMHITSIGASRNVNRQLDVVAQKGGGNPVILYWKE